MFWDPLRGGRPRLVIKFIKFFAGPISFLDCVFFIISLHFGFRLPVHRALLWIYVAFDVAQPPFVGQMCEFDLGGRVVGWGSCALSSVVAYAGRG